MDPTTEQQPDLELAERARSGDEFAWKEIFTRTSDRLFAFLCFQLGDREEALDLLQETYLRAFRRLHEYRGQGPLAAWLRMIALRKAIDWKRTVLKRWKRTVGLTESAAVTEPSEAVHFRSEREALEKALARLSPPQRAALLLREWEGWSFREIALTLRCREGTARVHHARARSRMRKELSHSPVAFATDEGGKQPV